MGNIRAAIICDDTLRAAGLQYLLSDGHGIDAVVTGDAVNADIYFITPDALVRLHRFFMPRMGRTVVLTHEPVSSPVLTLDTSQPLISLIDALEAIVNSLRESTDPSAQLTNREIDVLKLVARGYINKEIAATLNISFNTVLTHRKNIGAKLGVKSSQGLAIYAIMNGLISPGHP